MAGQPAVRIEIAFVGTAGQMRPRPAFWPRDNVRIVLRFSDAAAVKPTPVDGRGVRLVVQAPDMAPVEYTEAELTQDGLGVWHLDTSPEASGAWRVEGSCTEPVEAAVQARFDVRRELLDGLQRPDATVLAAETGEPLTTPGGALMTVQRLDRVAPADPLLGPEALAIVQGGAVRRQSVQGLLDAAAGAAQAVIGDLTARMAALEYVPPAIDGFGASPSEAEVGATVASVTLSVSRSRPSLPVVITGSNSATIAAGQSSVVVPGPFTAGAAWTARMTDPAPPPGKPAAAEAYAGLQFLLRSYRGPAASRALSNAAVLALPDQPLSGGYGVRDTVVACGSAGAYPTLIFPAAWGNPPGQVIAYGLPFTGFTVSQRSVTNAQGVAVPCHEIVFSDRQFGDVPVRW